MSRNLFDTLEEIAILKNDVIHDLHRVSEIYKPYFLTARRSRLLNPSKVQLERFTIHSTLFLLMSMSLLDPTQWSSLIPVIMCNYKLSRERAEELLEGMREHGENSEIIVLTKEKMRKHVDGMLKTHRLQDVMNMYRRHLTPRFYEKKNLGQVFTPFPLIDKILDQIPHEVMTNPNSKFFDPSAGMGGFLVDLYHRLMNTLAGTIRDKNQRHDHIISNMLFAAEITKNNVERMRRIFGSRLHVFQGDALTLTRDEMMRVFGIDQVTVIVGNPPFEKPQTKDAKKSGGDSLWDDFVRLSLEEWLAPYGFFGMVLPPGWRKPADNKSRCKGLWDLMTIQNTPLWIEMFDAKESSEWFNNMVSIRVDLVFLQKMRNNGVKTMIRGTDGRMYHEDLRKFPFLPNGHLKYWMKVLVRDPKDAVRVLFSSSVYESRKKFMKRERDAVFRHPVLHAIHRDGKPVYMYTSERKKEGGFGVKKLIFNEFGSWNPPKLDRSGKLGMTEHAIGVVIDSTEEGHEMQRFFGNDGVLNMYNNDLNWSTSRPTIPWKLFRHLRKNFWRTAL